MKKIAIALIFAVTSTAAFAQDANGGSTTGGTGVGADVTSLAPAGAASTAVAGTSVVIAGIGTATWVVVAGVLLLIVVSTAGANSTT